VIDRHTSFKPSPALLAAQVRLEKLREEQQARHKGAGSPIHARQRPRVNARVKSAAELGQLLLDERRRREAAAQGERASDALRSSLPPSTPKPRDRIEPSVTAEYRRAKPKDDKCIKLYPSIAVAMLDKSMEAPGRIWLLLKHLDSEGKGWLWLDDVREQLTRKKSSTRVCGWRRLRQLLNQGEHTFWTRDRKGRVWIKGAARVAQALDCKRLTGKPVSLPLAALLGGIKHVRAHLYTSFHSGRQKNNPISREKLKELTSVPERSQRDYEELVGVECRQNIAIGERYSEKEVQERAWRQGQAVFRFIDMEGRQGKPGQEYVAWHMPNSYEGPHNQRRKGRQKKINQQLKDLVKKGTRGNGREKVERLFWANGAAAGKAYNRNQDVDAYWPHRHSHAPQYILWGVVPGGSRSR
jgi:hypothetical protein